MEGRKEGKKERKKEREREKRKKGTEPKWLHSEKHQHQQK
jgi:hypothetical protein